MKQYHKNPRTMTKRQDSDLHRWLRELGDLSGIVHDLNSDEIIGGNQRGRIIDINNCEIVLSVENSQPDYQGTVAHGYVIWEGAKYAYRQVRWTPEQCEKANIIANKAGGDWDFDILANQYEVPDLLDWGFDDFELGKVPDDNEWADAFDKLPDEDRAPFQQMTFTLHDTQVERVKDALGLAKQLDDYNLDSPNENSNGNALAYIVDVFLSL